jgi:hypothetical protein
MAKSISVPFFSAGHKLMKYKWLWMATHTNNEAKNSMALRYEKVGDYYLLNFNTLIANLSKGLITGYFSNGNIRFQSCFMLMTSQPWLTASL